MSSEPRDLMEALKRSFDRRGSNHKSSSTGPEYVPSKEAAKAADDALWHHIALTEDDWDGAVHAALAAGVPVEMAALQAEVADVRADLRAMTEVAQDERATTMRVAEQRDTVETKVARYERVIADLREMADKWANADDEPVDAHGLATLTALNRHGREINAVLDTLTDTEPASDEGA